MSCEGEVQSDSLKSDLQNHSPRNLAPLHLVKHGLEFLKLSDGVMTSHLSPRSDLQGLDRILTGPDQGSDQLEFLANQHLKGGLERCGRYPHEDDRPCWSDVVACLDIWRSHAGRDEGRLGPEPISRCNNVRDQRVPALLEVDPLLGTEGETKLALLLATIYRRAKAWSAIGRR